MSNLQVFANNAQAEVLSAVGTGDGTILVGNGEIALFPTSLSGGRYFLVTLSDNTLLNNVRETKWEVVKVTAVTPSGSDLLLTVDRAQEGTAAQGWVIGQLASLRVTAGTLDEAFARPSFDDILTDGTNVLLGPTGDVLYTC